jgi:N-acetylmuramoyl-L-alanine amidase
VQRGAQVFYLSGEERGGQLAETLQVRLNALYAKEGVKARKNKSADYFILAYSSCPSVLIECGFLSSPKDEALLCDEAFLQSLTTEIYAGVVSFLFASA